MSAPTSFYDAPIETLSPDQAGSLLDTPFLIANVVGFEGDTPLFNIAFGAGMTKEDVPLVVDMLYDLFYAEIQARYDADREAVETADVNPA